MGCSSLPDPRPQAIVRHEQAPALRGMLGRYLELLTDRLVAAPADLSRLPQLYAALGAQQTAGGKYVMLNQQWCKLGGVL